MNTAAVYSKMVKMAAVLFLILFVASDPADAGSRKKRRPKLTVVTHIKPRPDSLAPAPAPVADDTPINPDSADSARNQKKGRNRDSAKPPTPKKNP